MKYTTKHFLKMKKTTTINGMNSLINIDFRITYNFIVGMFNETKFSIEDVQLAYEKTKAYNKKLDIYVMRDYTKHDNSRAIQQLREVRNESAQRLKDKVKYGLKSPIESERKAASILYEWIDKERDFLKSTGIEEQMKSAARTKQQVALMPALMESSSTLRIDGVIEFVIDTTCAIDENSKRCLAEQKKVTIRANKIRQDAYEAMQAFVEAIEVQAMLEKKDDEEVYGANLRIIETLVKDFKTQQKIRNTRRRNKRNKG